MPKRSGRESASQTPAPKKEQIRGSKVNPKGSASSERSASAIKFDAKTLVALTNKLKEFKDKHPNKSNITLADLKAVYRRGAGAYSSSHRPTISGGKPNSRNAWAMARVNKFLLKAGGTKVKKAYVQDDDLMKYEGGGVVKSKDDVNVPLYHGTMKEIWRNSDYESYLFVTHDFEFAKAQALDRAYYENGMPIVIKIYPSQIKNYKWEADDDLGRYIDFKNWQDSYNAIGSFVFIGKFNINDFEIIELKDDLMKMHLGGDMSKHLAPNGKPSNLTHEQWHLVRTPEFKAWFGDWENNANKMMTLDENGEPMVFWHSGGEWNELNKEGRYGSVGKLMFSISKNTPVSHREKGITRPFFLKSDYIYQVKYEDKDKNPATFRKGKNVKYPLYFVNAYGGFVIATEPNQIKLADGSNTTFDSSNPDIRYDDGGEVDYEDEFVKGYIRIDADQNVQILDWNSKYKEKRGTENSLKSLREVYNGDIVAIDVGYEGEPSFSYWEKMLHKGLIDGFIDDNAIYHNNSKFKVGGDLYRAYSKDELMFKKGGTTDKYEISDYWDTELFGEGGEVKTKKIITDKIGWSEDIADWFIEQDPKLAVWLADSVMRFHINTLDSYLSENQNIHDTKLADWDKKSFQEKKKVVTERFENIESFFTMSGIDSRNLQQQIRSILDWLKHPITPKQDLKKLTLVEAYQKSKEWHEELTALGGDIDFVEPEENEIFITYPKDKDGAEFYWVKIPSNFCSLESSRMGHCGRTGYGNTLISLRSVRPFGKGHTINDSHVTIAYNEKDGIFYQTKGKKNQKPAEKYHQYIFDLVKTLAQEDRRDYISEVQSKIVDFNEKKIFIENEQERISNEVVELRRERNKLEEVLSKVKNSRDYNEVNNRIDEVEAMLFKFKSDIKDLEFESQRLVAKILKEQDRIDDIEKMYPYGFGGFGAEYGSEEDYGYGEMNDEQVRELYEINPSLFSNLGGRIILYNRGIVQEKPDTAFIIEKDVEQIEDLLDYGGRSNFLQSVVMGDMYEALDLSVGKDETIRYYLNDLNEKNMNYVLEEISRITSIPIEEVRENGAKYYLSGDFFDEGEDDFYFDSITDAIRRAVESALQTDAYEYYYGEIKSTLSELGEVLNLNDEGIKIKVELANALTINQIEQYSQDIGDNLESIFFQAEYNQDITLPQLSFDDRFEPSADSKLINEYFEPDFYAKGGVISDEDKGETYAKWKSLVNMSKSELERFYNSQEGKDAGLSSSEANAQGIDSGRESARWVMKMKDTPYKEWTPQMWKWAKKQISFISRMSGNKGGLYDDKGNKTRKHTSLLIWGNNPEKMSGGGETKGDATYKDVVDLLTEYQFRERKTFSDKRYKLWRNSMKINGEEVDCFIDTEGKVIVLESQHGLKEIGYDLKFMESYFKKNRLKRNKYNNGGEINQTKTINMDNVRFNQLPHIDTISEGDDIILFESVFAGNIDQPKHIGERYIHCKAMKMGGMVNSLDLEVINSVGANPLVVGQTITRPITNVLVRGRKLIVEPIAQAIEFKDGGLNPDNKDVKGYFAHGSGNAGGVLVGKRHSEGGIKAINKSTGQPLEMEGGEVVITRGAVSNSKKYDFDGKEMTTREILSKLNVDGGGVSFAEGGDVPDKMNCGCKEFKLGGQTITPQDFVAMSEKEYQQTRLQEGIKKERNDHYDTLSKLNSGAITIDNALREIAQKEMSIDKKYPFSE
jgi:hypothetical protein